MNDHIIRKQSIEISFSDLNEAVGVQDSIATLYYEKLQPKMEVLFDEMFGKDAISSIERLEIDCGVLPKKNWEDEWVESCLREIKKQLISLPAIRTLSIEDLSEKYEDIVFFFLEFGRLPWNCSVRSIAAIEEKIKISKLFVTKLMELILKNKQSITRMTYSFSPAFRQSIMEICIQKYRDQWEIIKPVYDEAGIPERSSMQGTILHILSAKKADAEEFINLVYHYSSAPIKQRIKKISGAKKYITPKIPQIVKALSQNTHEKEIQETNKKNEELINPPGVYINNTGLIILHPFLPLFFENAGLTVNNRWKDEHAQKRAIQLLQYLVTANVAFQEFDLSLNKILCGVEINEAIVPEKLDLNEIKESCDILLADIIAQWKQLKNTGIDAFREAFLQRSGKLSKTDNGWLVQAERKPIDVLMNSLPWGIGIVKLPWMDEVLYVDWS